MAVQTEPIIGTTPFESLVVDGDVLVAAGQVLPGDPQQRTLGAIDVLEVTDDGSVAWLASTVSLLGSSSSHVYLDTTHLASIGEPAHLRKNGLSY
ncbi:MAG: hypothetical protein AAFZ65_18520 [Planctomycetota bacterium]